MLARRLQELQREGIVERRPNDGERGPTYHLTQAGRKFLPIVRALGVWGQHWSRRELAVGEVDFRLLLWSMESGVRPRCVRRRADRGAPGVHRPALRSALLLVRQ
jgi:DNA-binding MarR family transcriptional regulator